MLGSGGVIVMDETTSMVKALTNLAHFYAHESCGQCSPCREGTGWAHKILQRILAGEGRMEDLDQLKAIADNMAGKTICVLADALAMPIWSYLKHFRHEFEAQIKN
jgi:NADH-quinone oxidoreductase subunit F